MKEQSQLFFTCCTHFIWWFLVHAQNWGAHVMWCGGGVWRHLLSLSLCCSILFFPLLLSQAQSNRPASTAPYGGTYQGQNTSITPPKCSFCANNCAAWTICELMLRHCHLFCQRWANVVLWKGRGTWRGDLIITAARFCSISGTLVGTVTSSRMMSCIFASCPQYLEKCLLTAASQITSLS